MRIFTYYGESLTVIGVGNIDFIWREGRTTGEEIMQVRTIASVFLLTLFLAGTFAEGQERSRIVSPTIHADGTVTFRINAPDAASVMLAGQVLAVLDGAAPALEEDDDGVWSVTVGPVAPGLHGYLFNIAGAEVPDPLNNKVKIGHRGMMSAIEVPASAPQFFENKDVPHGTISIHWYDSETLGVQRRLHVYTPPGYGKGRRYPVLYLFHDGGDQDDAWLNKGNMNFVLDNLIAEGRAKEMVVVMPYGHAAFGAIAKPGGADSDVKAYEADLMETVIPYIEDHYRVRKGRKHRAIVGLSMGGGHALRIGLNHLETFRHVGAFSAGAAAEPKTAYAKVHDLPDWANKQLDLFWIGCGREDRLLPRSKKLIAFLEETGIEHIYKETNGAHTWEVWRRYL